MAKDMEQFRSPSKPTFQELQTQARIPCVRSAWRMMRKIQYNGWPMNCSHVCVALIVQCAVRAA